MNAELIRQIEEYLKTIILRHYKNKTINIFDEFIQLCQNYYEKPAHTLAELKLKTNTKLKGDIFEHFSLKYFKTCFGLSEVWLLKDLPQTLLEKLNLKRNDLGIDLIGQDQQGRFYAIQAKYRKKGYKLKQGIGWKQLSTFYALCNRTGPYFKHIIITNTDFVRHIGKKTKQDISICQARLRSIPLDQWIQMANFQGTSIQQSLIQESGQNPQDQKPKPLLIKKKKVLIKKISEGKPSVASEGKPTDAPEGKPIVSSKKPQTLEELREKRLQFYSKLLNDPINKDE